MDEKWANITDDDDTVIFTRIEARIGEYPVLHESWAWSGIKAESIVFETVDLGEKSDQEVIEIIRSTPLVEDKSKEITIRRSDTGYTLVNFNFKAPD